MTLTALMPSDYPLLRIEGKKVVYDLLPSSSWPNCPRQADGEAQDVYYERLRQWFRDTRRLVPPEPGQFKAPLPRNPQETVDLKRDYGERGLQVIVKLAS